MTLLKPSRAKIATTFMFIAFYLLNSAMQSVPKELYKQEAKKYYTFKGETPEIVKSRDKYISEAYAQLTTPIWTLPTSSEQSFAFAPVVSAVAFVYPACFGLTALATL